MKTETGMSLKYLRARKMVSDIAGKQLMKFKIDIRSLDGLPHFITPRVHASY